MHELRMSLFHRRPLLKKRHESQARRETRVPVRSVEPNIRRKGSQVPSQLPNIARLPLIKSATKKKSTITTKPRKIAAVRSGEVL